jgi:hypothetical protein
MARKKLSDEEKIIAYRNFMILKNYTDPSVKTENGKIKCRYKNNILKRVPCKPQKIAIKSGKYFKVFKIKK